MINTSNWNYDISFTTVVLIVASVFLFVIGSLFSRNKAANIALRDSGFRQFNSKNRNEVRIVLLLVSLVCLVVRLLDVFLTVGSLDIFSGVLGVYRGLGEKSALATLVSFCSPAISACLIVEFVDYIYERKKNSKHLLFSILILLIGLAYFVLSSSRIEILYIFVYLIICILFGLKIKGERLGAKAFFSLVFLSVLLFVVFFLAGFLTGKSQNQVSLFDNISLYAGSSIATFDSWIGTFVYEGKNFGITIFRGLNNILSWFGIRLPISFETDLGFRTIGEMAHTSNVYSCLAEYIVDVGYIGTAVILLLEGFLLTKLYNKAIEGAKKGNRLIVCIYVYLAPLIVFSSIAERMFRTFLTVSTLAFVVVVFFVERINKGKERVR